MVGVRFAVLAQVRSSLQDSVAQRLRMNAALHESLRQLASGVHLLMIARRV